ncbi:MAG: hypothetical protein HY942_05630 [Gammaproteobacteria bacterium]|nr:hypothetical protein [Gammaproteobacteria bacterium]
MLTKIVRRWTAGLIGCLLVWAAVGYADDTGVIPPSAKDPHYTDVGFFDIHICHWPDRPMFYMLVFSTTQFERVQEVEVLKPDGEALCKLDLGRYNVKQKTGSPEKRVFITQLPVGAGAADGWYKARIRLTDGRVYGAEDYVRIERMALADKGLSPPDAAENVALPKELRWGAVPTARYYKVFVFDKWDDGKKVFESKLLTEPALSLPDGVLQPGGWYAWRVHGRDINEDIELGDFNHGSLTGEFQFTVAQ